MSRVRNTILRTEGSASACGPKPSAGGSALSGIAKQCPPPETSDPRIRLLAALSGIGSVVLAAMVPLLGGLARPGYSHCAQFISELGERDAINGVAISLLGFLPIGALVIAFVALAGSCLPQSTVLRGAMVCISGVGFAYVTAAFARCDPGCPPSGSPTQAVHNLLGLVEYLGAGIGLLLFASAIRPKWPAMRGQSIAASLLVWIGLLGMLSGLLEWRGLFQRIAETAIFAWMLAVSLRLLRERAGDLQR